MGNRRDSVAHNVESIRVQEVRRLLNKLSPSPEQKEAIENLSRSLIEELVRGPIAKTLAHLQEEPAEELVATGKSLHARRGS
jgi:glutamyl-tRNA reductase